MKRVAFLSLLLIAGCATAVINSSYNQETKINFKRAYIICWDNYNDGFLKIFADSLNKKLLQRNIEAKLLFINQLTYVTDTGMKRSIHDFNPDAVIELYRDANNLVRVKAGYTYLGGNYYLGVRKTSEEVDCWKAMISTQNEDAFSNIKISGVVKNVLDMMQEKIVQ